MVTHCSDPLGMRVCVTARGEPLGAAKVAASDEGTLEWIVQERDDGY